MEQTIERRLSPEQVVDLALFDRQLDYDPARGELGARSDREEVNFLRLNLADDIIERRLSSEEARDLFARMLRLEAAGKSSPYLKSLRFPR